jgi:hypothetical protein
MAAAFELQPIKRLSSVTARFAMHQPAGRRFETRRHARIAATGRLSAQVHARGQSARIGLTSVPMNEELLAATRRSIELHARRVAELESTISGLQELLRQLATSTLQLLEMSPPRRPADAVIVGEIVKRARRVLARLEPPKRS